ncbi:MAG: RIO1 family regulatory kinase/ATPase [Bacteroidota bacterium]
MDTKIFEFFDNLDDNESLNAYLQHDAQRPRNPKGRLGKKLESEEQTFIRSQDSTRGTIGFTYKAARFEEWWLLESLNEFYEEGWIVDVLRRVKGGKEASVYQCRSGAAIGGDLAAAKVYRPRSMRNLRNDGLYREGRAYFDGDGHDIKKDKTLKAITKKTQYGRELQHQSWIAHEFLFMQDLHAAGADVPEPYTMANNAILMEFVGDANACAPALNEVGLPRSEARPLFDRVLSNLDLLLAHERIHGDLSAYNVLYWKGGITMIDFPQVISPLVNKHAYRIFSRDVKRICDYFASQGVRSDPTRLAEDLWTSHGYRLPRSSPEEDESGAGQRPAPPGLATA